MFSLSTKRILIVDDDIEMAELMGEMLRRADYETVLAHDGIQAIEKSRHEKINLILLDIRMPFFSGFWFCDAFKQRSETREVPVIFVSGLVGPDNIQRAYDVGGAGYLKKPFLPEELLELVKQLI